MGKIITFYSYKGGVGRSMALANTAILLAQHDRVLVVDWDLDAPGIEHYLEPLEFNSKETAQKEGVIDLLINIQKRGYTVGEPLDWKKFIISTIPQNNNKALDLLLAGKNDHEYANQLDNLNINHLYEHKGGTEFFESLRNEWKQEYDFVLIDSRTGITDTGDICTIQMPDTVILLFSFNEQNLSGILKLAKRAGEAQQELPNDRLRLKFIPIPSRVDSTKEHNLFQKWMDRVAKECQPLYQNWLPRHVNRHDFLERTKIPYMPYFSFGEKLPALEPSSGDTTGPGHHLENLAALIRNNLESPEQIIKNRDTYVRNSRLIKIDNAPTDHEDHPISQLDPHWRVKLDRLGQYGQVFQQVHEMLKESKPRALAFLWYGNPDQGVDLFHERLRVHLRPHLQDTNFLEITMRWPEAMSAPIEDALQSMFLEAFHIQDINEISGRIREIVQNESGQESFIYFRHEPLDWPDGRITPIHIKEYVQWWDRQFLPLLTEARAFGLLGISFVADRSNALQKQLRRELKIEQLPLQEATLHIL